MENEKIEILIDNLLFVTINNPPKWKHRENDKFELYLPTGTIHLFCKNNSTESKIYVVIKVISNQNTNTTIATLEKDSNCCDNNLVKLYRSVIEHHKKHKSSLLETLIKETKDLF